MCRRGRYYYVQSTTTVPMDVSLSVHVDVSAMPFDALALAALTFLTQF